MTSPRCNHTKSIPAHLEIGQPRSLPLVASYRVMFCENPACGPHLVCLDLNDMPFCELLMSPEQVTQLEQRTLDNLRRK